MRSWRPGREAAGSRGRPARVREAKQVACPAQAILASNTSSLGITEIAAATKRPDRVLGMHFFNPVHLMKLLELIRGHMTSEATLAAARAVGVKMGKELIVAADIPGFATSR